MQIVSILLYLSFSGEKVYAYLEVRLIYGLAIRYFIESYLEILMSAHIHINQLNWNTNGDTLAGVIAIILATLCIVLPFAFTYLLFRNFSRIDSI